MLCRYDKTKTNKTEDCDKFWVEFGRYDLKSLKNKLRSNETEGFGFCLLCVIKCLILLE